MTPLMFAKTMLMVVAGEQLQLQQLLPVLLLLFLSNGVAADKANDLLLSEDSAVAPTRVLQVVVCLNRSGIVIYRSH